MSKHASEPWTISGPSYNDGESYTIVDGKSNIVAWTVEEHLEAPASDVDAERAALREKANARRIVAAVNATEGIPTEALEDDALERLIHSAIAVIDSECGIQSVSELRKAAFDCNLWPW